MIAGMSDHETFCDALGARLLLAIVGASAGAMACRSEAPRIKNDTPAGPMRESPTNTAVPRTSAAPKVVCAEGGSAGESCYEPFAAARSVGTGEAAPRPPRSAYDANGCLPKEQVTNGCCNPAVGGPRVQGKKCCYDFCAGPCCGRPFLVDGHARVAALQTRSDWAASDVAPIFVGDIDAQTRRSLAEAWRTDAQMEHASVAAFGRFLLRLLALGAPAALVHGAVLAAADEVTHAELCFAIARQLSGVAMGPRPLSLDGALEKQTLGEVIAEVIREGCVGETVAAMIASRQLESAREPSVRRALERISVDEARHAELAWSFVHWAVASGGEAARDSAAATFAEVLDANAKRPGAPAVQDESVAASHMRAFGHLSAYERDQTMRRAIDQIVAQCARALLTTSQVPSHLAERDARR